MSVAAKRNKMLAAILLTCLLQVMVALCKDVEANVTSKVGVSQGSANVSNIIKSNGTATNITSSKTNINQTNTNISNVSQSNTTASFSNASVSDADQNTTCVSTGCTEKESNDTANTDDLEAESSISTEVTLAGTPVMSDCLNGTVDSSVCMERLLNLTMECANETGATQDDVDIAMRMEIPSSDTGKCLTKCLLKLRGVMSPEGAFSSVGTVGYLTEVYKNESLQGEFQKLADYCYGKLKLQPMSSLDSCQFAYDIAFCTEEYHKTLFLRNPALAPPVNAITTP